MKIIKSKFYIINNNYIHKYKFKNTALLYREEKNDKKNVRKVVDR